MNHDFRYAGNRRLLSKTIYHQGARYKFSGRESTKPGGMRVQVCETKAELYQEASDRQVWWVRDADVFWAQYFLNNEPVSVKRMPIFLLWSRHQATLPVSPVPAITWIDECFVWAARLTKRCHHSSPFSILYPLGRQALLTALRNTMKRLEFFMSFLSPLTAERVYTPTFRYILW